MQELDRKRKLKDEDEGVATTVGTIMALLIFLSVLSLITQQYVPVWIHDSEAHHMQEVRGDFGEFKSNIDDLIIRDDIDYPQYSSLKLGTEGIPIFANPSRGRLTYEPSGENSNVSMRFTSADEGDLWRNSSGNLEYTAQNREFEEQSLIYEQGAIILEQEDEGAIMRARPHYRFREDRASITMVNFIGLSEDLVGNARVDINLERTSMDTGTFNLDDVEDNFNLTMGTSYEEAWYNYFVNETALEEDEVKRGEGYVKIGGNNGGYSPDEIEFTKISVLVSITV